MYGKMVLVGRLGGDPEMKYTPSGTAITNMSVAVDQGYGENKKTLWVRVACWGNKDGTGGKAEAAANYLHKGSLVFVEGEPTVRAYTAADGEARASLEVNAREIKFLDPKPQENGNGQQARPAARPAAQTPLAAAAATAATGYSQISPDKKYGWDGKAWVPIPAPVTAPPPPPPPPPPADDTASDVDPDEIPFS